MATRKAKTSKTPKKRNMKFSKNFFVLVISIVVFAVALGAAGAFGIIPTSLFLPGSQSTEDAGVDPDLLVAAAGPIGLEEAWCIPGEPRTEANCTFDYNTNQDWSSFTDDDVAHLGNDPRAGDFVFINNVDQARTKLHARVAYGHTASISNGDNEVLMVKYWSPSLGIPKPLYDQGSYIATLPNAVRTGSNVNNYRNYFMTDDCDYPKADGAENYYTDVPTTSATECDNGPNIFTYEFEIPNFETGSIIILYAGRPSVVKPDRSGTVAIPDEQQTSSYHMSRFYAQGTSTCPADGSVNVPPADAVPLPFGNLLYPASATLTTGKYYTDSSITISGNLNIVGAVEIYSRGTIDVRGPGRISANAAGNAGGSGAVGRRVTDAGGHGFRSPNTSGVGYCPSGLPGCVFEAFQSGGGGEKAPVIDGGGGGGYGAEGGDGSRGGINGNATPGNGVGGTENWFGLNENSYGIRMGSGGGGGSCRNGGNQCKGGNGGGSIGLFADVLRIRNGSNIYANGQDAPDNALDTAMRTVIAGSGGSGGGIILSGNDVQIRGNLEAHGGQGGDNPDAVYPCVYDADGQNGYDEGVDASENDDAGAGGSGGRIKIFYDPARTDASQINPTTRTDGGEGGCQSATNGPTAGDNGSFTSQVCGTSEPQVCEGNWDFKLDNHSVNPVPGGLVFYSGFLTASNFEGERATIRHILDPNETLVANGAPIVYGDWHGINVNAQSDQWYKFCGSFNQGTWQGPADSYSKISEGAETTAIWHTVATDGKTYEQRIDTFDVPTATSPPKVISKAFKPTWGGAQNWKMDVAIRTGSYYDSWFTGSLRIDDVAVFRCGADEASCNTAALSCTASNINSPSKNLIQNIQRNATFDDVCTGDNCNDWTHASAAPFPNLISTAAERGPAADQYNEIRSTNNFVQTVSNCSADGRCKEWNGTIVGRNTDFTLYAISRVNDNTVCGWNFTHSAEGSVNGCEPITGEDKSGVLICPSLPNPEVLAPSQVCLGESFRMSGEIGTPDPLSDDIYQYRWTSTGPTITPSSFTDDDGDGQVTSDPVVASTPGNFSVGLQARSTGRPDEIVNSENFTVEVIECSSEPSENINFSGRTYLNPPQGTTEFNDQILDWKEIIGEIN